MNKKLIRLTEGDLHRIVKRCVRTVMAESEDIPGYLPARKELTDDGYEIGYNEYNPRKHNGLTLDEPKQSKINRRALTLDEPKQSKINRRALTLDDMDM